MGHIAPELEGNKARGQPQVNVDRYDLHAHGFNGKAHGSKAQAKIFRRRKQKPGSAEAVDTLKRGHVAQNLGAPRGVEDRARQLAIGLMQGVERHDLYRERGCGKLRTAKKIHQGRALGQGKTRKIGGNHIQQGRKARKQAAHGLTVVIAPGNGKLAHHKGCHG